MEPNGSRTAAGLVAFLLLAAGITSAVLVAGSATPAAAADLARFSSCAELRSWSSEIVAEVPVAMGEAEGAGGQAARTAPASEDSGSDEALAEAGGAGGSSTAPSPADGGTGGTNTVVEGVDEIDVVDRLPGDRALVSRNGVLSLVDLTGPALITSLRGLPFDARIAVDGDVVWAAGAATDGIGIAVQRIRLDGDALTVDGEWRSPGFLVDARRAGDTLYVVAVDHPQGPGVLPFEGGPVACDEVWYPAAGADTPAATLLVGLPSSGELVPTGAAEVVGAGSGFLVTGDAAYVTTQTWAEEIVTGIHRFDLASLQPTGSGQVPGAVPGPFGLNEYEGHLRVATSAGMGGMVGMIEPAIDVAADDVGAPEPDRPATAFGGSLAEVFVLDVEGDLDVVGRTGRFGHDGETIHGVRFVGATAYVVTFLQTDPFWVIDLADPASPRIVGELQIPGFSGYLHPLGDGLVVGFGPDGSGKMAARLFDVGDPQAPSVVDETTLGDDTPVAWDYHAFVSLGSARFAVPVTTYPRFTECAVPEPRPIDPTLVEPDQGCAPQADAPGSTGAIVLEVRDGRLAVAEEATTPTDGSVTAERVLPTEAGRWVLLSWDRLVAVGGDQLLLPAG